MMSYDEQAPRLWVERYNAPKSKRQAETVYHSFHNFVTSTYPDYKFNNFLDKMKDTTKENKIKIIDKLVQYWVKQNMTNCSIKNYLTFVKDFCYYRSIELPEKEINRHIKIPIPIKELRKPLTVQQIQSLLSFADDTAKAFFLTALSSGARLGEILALKKEDFDLSKRPIQIRIRAETTKTKTERITYITDQAWQYVEPLYRLHQTGKIFPYTADMIQLVMKALRKQAKLLDKYHSTGNYYINIHSFRAFTRTKLSDRFGLEFACFILGQTTALSQYYRKTPEECAANYKIIESELTIPLSEDTA